MDRTVPSSAALLLDHIITKTRGATKYGITHRKLAEHRDVATMTAVLSAIAL